MDLRTLQNTVIDALEDLKAHDIKAFSTLGLTDLFDRVIVATGTSNRHTKALAASVRDKVKTRGGAIISVEGEETGEWVLVDLGDIVVHIMQPAIRNYYNLEELWGARPVQNKSGTDRVASKARRVGAPGKNLTTKTAPRSGAKSGAKTVTKAPAKAARKAAPRRVAKKTSVQ